MNIELKNGFRRCDILPATGLLVLSLALVGCLDSSDDVSRDVSDSDYTEDLADHYAEVVVDASSYSSFTGLNLRTGATTQDLESDDWHIALQRYDNVLLNGGVKGGGSVEAALAHEQADFYDGDGDPVENVFVNATPDMYEADLLYPYDPAELDFDGESFLPAFGEWSDWANYNHASGGYVYADEDHYWVVQGTEGSYFVVQLVDDGDALFFTRDSDATFEDAAITLSITPISGDGSFDLNDATQVKAELDDPRGSVYIDLDTGTYSTSATSDWDIRYTVETSSSGMGTGSVGVLLLNGGVLSEEGAALHTESPFTESEIGTLDGTDPGFGFAFESDSVDNVFTQNEWFRYGVAGGHRMHPNYRVFAVELNDDEGDDIVLVQATRYYHPESGTSGHVTLRARLLN